MATRRRNVLAVMVLVGSGSLGACSGDSEPEAGEVFPADELAIPARAFDVLVPTGTVQVRVRTAAQTVPGGDTADGTALDAVEGLRYLGLGWTLTSSGAPPDAAGLLSGVPERPALALVDGDERIDLGPAGGAGGVFVAVPEDLPERGHLEVGFDGVLQRVPLDGYRVDPGDAAALYDAPPAPRAELDCTGPVTGPGVVARQTCGALVVELPWTPEAGWAPAGGTWAAVRLETRLDTVEVGRGTGAASYTVTGAEAAATLGGAAPVATLTRPTTGPGDTAAWLVFPMPDEPAELVVEATYAADRTSGGEGQPAARDFTTTSTVEVRPSATGR
ncbi:MAG TPA: hypothetical protein VNS46_05080 [Nocardioides sp.]|nr:hypothetical protein [Nocardioides sp.]